MAETVIFDYMSPHCNPVLQDSKPIFLHDTLAHDASSPYQVWLHKIQQLRDIIQMNIHWNSEPFLWPWPWKQQSNFYTKHSSLSRCTIKLNLVAKRSAVQQITPYYGRSSHIRLNEPSVWPWTWRQQTNLLARHFGPRCCIIIPRLVTEGSAAEEISLR